VPAGNPWWTLGVGHRNIATVSDIPMCNVGRLRVHDRDGRLRPEIISENISENISETAGDHLGEHLGEHIGDGRRSSQFDSSVRVEGRAVSRGDVCETLRCREGGVVPSWPTPRSASARSRMRSERGCRQRACVCSRL
jgi:hypothetical protein